jgi:hypothetical protein
MTNMRSARSVMRKTMAVRSRPAAVFCVAFLLSGGSVLFAADWPQHQRDRYRTARTTDTVPMSYRMRWMWFGDRVIRNTLSNPAWTGADCGVLPPGTTVNAVVPLPSSSGVSLAEGMQPLVVAGRLYVADMQGYAHCVDASTGGVIWRAANPGGCMVTGVHEGDRVVYGNIDGSVRCFGVSDGSMLWEAFTEAAITGAPVSDGTNVYVGTHEGRVYAFSLASGARVWRSVHLGAQVAAGLAMDENSVYVCVENMVVYALRAADGSIRHSTKVQGQSFYRLWPVVWSSYVFVSAGAIPCLGSEYIGEVVMSSATDVEDEQDRWLEWLRGEGSYVDQSRDWKNLTVLRRDDFTEPFQVPRPPFDGCGTPPLPPCADNEGRLLTYFKTKFPSLCVSPPFGTNYRIDISGIDPATGRRMLIRSSQPCMIWMWETDNCYGMSVGGDYLYLRQEGRGTQCINLKTGAYRYIQNRWGDAEDINYGGFPAVWNRTIRSGRIPPVVADGRLYIVDDFGVTSIEHHQ